MIVMKNLKSKTASAEVKCSACDGTGRPAVEQPAKPGRRIFPPACKQCHGKGRVTLA
jgi:DnaJ-class molecular chaperone